MDSRQFPREFKAPDGRVLVVDRACLDDVDEVREFIQQHFMAIVPNYLLISYDVLCREKARPFLEAYTNLFRNNQSVSLIVRGDGARLVAIMVNRIEHRDVDRAKPLHHPNLSSSKDELPIFAILRTLYQNLNVFELYETDTIFHLEMVAVRGDHCRLGLATHLIQLSIQIGQANKVGVFIIEAVNVYSSKIASSFGFETIKEIVYKDFEYGGSRPFVLHLQELGEHRSAQLMALKLNLPAE